MDNKKIGYVFRSPRYPAIAVSGDRLFAVHSVKGLEKLIEGEQTDKLRLLDSTWEWFVYFPDLLALAPSFPMSQPPSKLQLIEMVNTRINRPSNSALCRTNSLSSRSRVEIFRELIALLDCNK